MKIKGYRQIDGKWVAFEDKVGFKEYIQHLWYSVYTILSYYFRKLGKKND